MNTGRPSAATKGRNHRSRNLPHFPILSFPRKRESRAATPSLALDARFRGNDNAGDGYENIHKTLRLAAAVIQTRLLCAEGAILLSVLICVHVWSSFQPAQSVFEARYPAYSAEAGRPRSSRRRSCDCRTPASTSAPPSSCRGVGYIAKATVVMRTATTGVRLTHTDPT